MNIGALDRQIEIQQKTITQDATTGQDVETWAALATVWANVQDVMPSKSESVLSGSIETSINRTRIRIRWLSGLTSANRIKITYPDVRYLQIVGGPAEIGGNRAFHELMCEQVSTP